MTTDIPISEITAGWDIDTTKIPVVSPATVATGGTRYYNMWYFPVSGGEGKRIATKVAPLKPRPTRAELKVLAKSQGQNLGRGRCGALESFLLCFFRLHLIVLDCSVFIN